MLKVNHEEPPKAEAHKEHKSDTPAMTRILVQDTPDMINQGISKISNMRKLGYRPVDTKANPDLDTGVENYIYMECPTEQVEARRKKIAKADRDALYGPIGADAVSPHGSAIKQIGEGVESLEPQEIKAIQDAGKAALGN